MMQVGAMVRWRPTLWRHNGDMYVINLKQSREEKKNDKPKARKWAKALDSSEKQKEREREATRIQSKFLNLTLCVRWMCWSFRV